MGRLPALGKTLKGYWFWLTGSHGHSSAAHFWYLPSPCCTSAISSRDIYSYSYSYPGPVVQGTGRRFPKPSIRVRVPADPRGTRPAGSWMRPAKPHAAGFDSRAGLLEVFHLWSASIPKRGRRSPEDYAACGTYMLVNGMTHRHATAEPVEHNHLGGGVPHDHDPETGFQIPQSTVTCEERPS